MNGTSEEVVLKLVEAATARGGWCKLEEVLTDDRRRTVHLNCAAVRLVVDENDAHM